MPVHGAFTIVAGPSDEGRRLDAVVASHIPDCSRALAVKLIVTHKILVDDQHKKPGYRVKCGNQITGQLPEPELVAYEPEAIPLQILYQDAHIVVINKQPGLVVHPAPAHSSGTLVNALLYHCPDLSGIGGEIRPGIVHRLDKDTSGTMVVAKNADAHAALAGQFKARKIQKKYLALVHGAPQSDRGSIQLPIGRHPVDRKRMSTITRRGRDAETTWKVCERFTGMTLLEVHIKTGRTHQIRVHCATMGHPIVGDPIYRSRKLQKTITSNTATLASDIVNPATRQMLHAWRLCLAHPYTGEIMTFESPIPTDMQTVIEKLRRMP